MESWVTSCTIVAKIELAKPSLTIWFYISLIQMK